MHWSFYLCLFVAVWQATVVGARIVYKNNIQVWHFLLLAAAIVGCVYSAVELSR